MSRRGRPDPATPLPDPLAPLLWRAARRVGPREAAWAFALARPRVLAAFRPRLAAMGLGPDLVEAALARVRRPGDWSDGWMWAAQRALGDARRAATAGDGLAEAAAKRQAALAFHAASWPPPDPRTLRTLRSSVAVLFADAAAALDPGLQVLAVPWRAASLPALLAKPPAAPAPAPLVVLLNGLTTAKEETIAWTEPFLWRGLAVLAIDWPGTGAATAAGPLDDPADLLDGAVALARSDPALDAARIAAVGVSLGGALAVRVAARDRRVRAVVAVTPPFDAARWLDRAAPVVRSHIEAHVPVPGSAAALAAEWALAGPAQRVACPSLVFGAGRDLVAPPAEAVRLAAALGDRATLVWRRNAGHALFDRIPAWTTEAAAWLEFVLAADSTRVDHESPLDQHG